MSATLVAIQKILKESSNKDALEASQKFVPGNNNLYGVIMPVLNNIARDFKAGGFGLIKELWDAGAFEEKILAAKLLERTAKNDAIQSLQLIQYFAKGIDNWAVCDALGMQALKSITKTHQPEIFALAKKYNGSKNLWERRLSLVLIEYYTRDKSLLPEINKLVQALENDEEYYVKKAVVWIKRNISKEKQGCYK